MENNIESGRVPERRESEATEPTYTEDQIERLTALNDALEEAMSEPVIPHDLRPLDTEAEREKTGFQEEKKSIEARAGYLKRNLMACLAAFSVGMASENVDAQTDSMKPSAENAASSQYLHVVEQLASSVEKRFSSKEGRPFLGGAERISKQLGFDIDASFDKEKFLSTTSVYEGDATKTLIMYDQLHASTDTVINKAAAPYVLKSQVGFSQSIEAMVKAQPKKIMVMNEGYAMEAVEGHEIIKDFISVELPALPWSDTSIAVIAERFTSAGDRDQVVLGHAIKEWAEKVHGKKTRYDPQADTLEILDGTDTTVLKLPGIERFEGSSLSIEEQAKMLSAAKIAEHAFPDRVQITTAEPAGYDFHEEVGLPGTPYRKVRDESMVDKAQLNLLTHDGPVVLLVGADHHETIAKIVKERNKDIREGRAEGPILNVLNITRKLK